VGTSSASQKVTLNNGRGTALNISGFSFSGSNPGSFTQTNNCGSSVAAGSSCSINGTFTPFGNGALSATLNVNDDATNTPQTVSLTGTGVGAPVTLSTTSITFGSVIVNSSKSAMVTVTNNQSVALTGISIVGSGAPFSQTNTCGASIAAHAQC